MKSRIRYPRDFLINREPSGWGGGPPPPPPPRGWPLTRSNQRVWSSCFVMPFIELWLALMRYPLSVWLRLDWMRQGCFPVFDSPSFTSSFSSLCDTIASDGFYRVLLKWNRFWLHSGSRPTKCYWFWIRVFERFLTPSLVFFPLGSRWPKSPHRFLILMASRDR